MVTGAIACVMRPTLVLLSLPTIVVWGLNMLRFIGNYKSIPGALETIENFFINNNTENFFTQSIPYK